jgi:hypothetical protein
MSDLTTVIEVPMVEGPTAEFPTEEVYLFPLWPARPAPAADPDDPFGATAFAPRWWPGDSPAE